MPHLNVCLPRGMLLVALGWSTLGHAQPVAPQRLFWLEWRDRLMQRKAK